MNGSNKLNNTQKKKVQPFKVDLEVQKSAVPLRSKQDKKLVKEKS